MTTLLAGSTAYGNITATWDAPTGTWTKLRLVRNSNGIPRSEIDGDLLFEDPFASARTSYSDVGLTSDRYYYYALFTLAAGVWSSVASTSALIGKDWGYTAKLYSHLPEVFKDVPDGVTEESTFLYRFLSVFGFQLDYIRTETESLRHLRDANLVNLAMLPALSAEVGVDYEPEIGTRSLRHFIANAVHLWSIKGTIPGVRELASVITGYVIHVRIGRNLALDNLDAGPSTDVGRLKGRTNCVVTYRANDINVVNPAGNGVWLITPVATGACVADTNRGDADALLRRQYAIPILPSRDYVVSRYLRTAGAATTGRVLAQWLDADGAVIGSPTGASAITVNGSWSRPTSVVTAPAGARYLEPSVVLGSTAAGQVVESCGFMVQEASAVDVWQCAREILVYLDAELINYVGNTSGFANEGWGWSAGVSAAQDATLGPYLTKFVPDPEDPNIIVLLDALAVTVTGDAVPTPPAPADSFATTVVSYTSGHQAVTAGQVWTAMADLTPPTTDGVGVSRTGRVGFLLYNGSTLVGSSYGVEVQLVRGAWTSTSYELTIPAGAAYDHIEAAISTEGLCGFRHVALEAAPALKAFFFDGSSPSDTGDYLWEGVAFRSPTHYYSRRAARTVRLKGLLKDYLPHGACFDLVFASAVSTSPQSISGADADPTTSLPL